MRTLDPQSSPPEQKHGPVASPHDVDTTLVAELLRLSVVQRLQHNDRMIATVKQLRAAFTQRQADRGNSGE